jgi:hypothetical protein
MYIDILIKSQTRLKKHVHPKYPGGTQSSTVVFQHVGRSFNSMAHKLARSSDLGVCNLSFPAVSDYIRGELCIDTD